MSTSNDNDTLNAPEPGDTSAARPDAPQTEPDDYQKLLAEKDRYYDLALRKQAELENFRKRTQREKQEFFEHANADLVESLLPVLDAFERALKHRDPASPARFYEGLELIYRQLLDALGRAGLEAVETEGALFDPNIHQAAETVASPRFRDNEVVEELQRGYTLKHRLLRPASVKVAVHPAAGADDREAPEARNKSLG